MKRFFLGIALLCSLCCNAQTITTQSSCDSNGDGTVDVLDVTNTANKVIQKAAEEQNMVTAEQLNTLLTEINTKLDKLKDMENRLLYMEKSGVYNYPFVDGHEYVEIGGLKWATMNLGATTVAGSPTTCYGDYYAWGETEPRYTSITISGANSVSFGDWSSSHSSGYSASDYPSYTGTTLDATHDAATKNWGSNWRTPTLEDFQALANACSSSQEILTLSTSTPTGGIYWLSSKQEYLSEYKGVAGILFVDNTDTSKRVFFPAAGGCSSALFGYGGVRGYYWSSTLNTLYTDNAHYLYFNSLLVGPSFDIINRYYGWPVRPVCK